MKFNTVRNKIICEMAAKLLILQRNFIKRKKLNILKLGLAIVILTSIMYKIHLIRKEMKWRRFWSNIQQMRRSYELINVNHLTAVSNISLDDVPYTHRSILSHSSADAFRISNISYIPGLNNPCFQFNSSLRLKSAENSSKILEMACLPHYYIAGFTKAGTSDLNMRLTMHQHILTSKVKEFHFWDNNRNYVYYTFKKYFSSTNDLTGIIKEECIQNSRIVKDCPYIFGDGTPCTSWYADRWDEEETNSGLDEPAMIIPHKIHTITPNAKIILMLRNPVTRLFSDYKYYSFLKLQSQGGSSINPSAEDFHDKVMDAVDWWKHCTEKAILSPRRCAYGIRYPPELPKLGLEVNCPDFMKCRPMLNFWKGPSADRLRIGIYHIFIKDWLSVFPRENILILKFEEYIKDPLKVLEKSILPFLNLDPFRSIIWKYLDAFQKSGYKSNSADGDFQMFNKTKKMLQEFYSPHNVMLSQLIQDDYFKNNW